MCFFFSCSPWHKPTAYFSGACNQFDFGLILKCKDQLSISENSDGSSTSVFSSIIFQKLPKTLFLGVSIAFSRKPEMMESFWIRVQCKMPSEITGAILFAQKKFKFAGLYYWSLYDDNFKHCSFAEIHVTLFTYKHNESLQPYRQVYELTSHPTYVGCINFIHKRRNLYFFKLTANDRFLRYFP